MFRRTLFFRCKSAPVYDAIIIGAGLSGLTAAATLKAQGDSNVKVLEASGRIGGRVWTAEDDNTLELGAAFYGPGQNRMFSLIDKFKLQTIDPTHGSSPNSADSLLITAQAPRRNPFQFSNSGCSNNNNNNNRRNLVAFRWNGNKSITPNYSRFVALDMNNALRKLEALEQTVDPVCPDKMPGAAELDSIRLPEFFDQLCWTRAAYHFLLGNMRVLLTTDPENVSALYMLWFVRAAGGFNALMHGESWKLQGGNSQIIDHLVQDLGADCVETNTALRGIAKDGDSNLLQLSVSSQLQGAKIVSARHVVFAIPPTQIQRIHFDAASLPSMTTERRLLLESYSMGQCIKTFTYFSSPWWRQNKSGLSARIVCSSGVSTASAPELPFPASDIFDLSDQSRPCLLGFIETSDGARWASRTPEERRDALVKQYEAAMNDSQKLDNVLVTGYREKVWAEEEWVGGAFFAVPRAGAFSRLWTTPMEDKIFFAGTEAATEWSGYLEGAVESGERAARSVLVKLGKLDESQYEKTVAVPTPPGRPDKCGSMVVRSGLRALNPDSIVQFAAGLGTSMVVMNVLSFMEWFGW